MIVNVTLEKEDFDSMHDAIYDVLDYEPTYDQIQAIWDKLPEDIKATGIQWGTSDTVFRDDFYVWLQKNKNNV